MALRSYVIVTDRGGHLHNAKMLLRQLGFPPVAIATTQGPETLPLKQSYRVFTLPYIFTWIGKFRFLNPLNIVANLFLAFWYAVRLHPEVVVSLGATNVVFFCYWARMLGSQVVHVECMNQVRTRSMTGRLLYPICTQIFVQWEDLLSLYGPKATYAGWVL